MTLALALLVILVAFGAIRLLLTPLTPQQRRDQAQEEHDLFLSQQESDRRFRGDWS